MNEAQQKICDYLSSGLRGEQPTTHTLRCFVGMIEGGEATWGDFRAVGGEPLVAAVEKMQRELEDS